MELMPRKRISIFVVFGESTSLAKFKWGGIWWWSGFAVFPGGQHAYLHKNTNRQKYIFLFQELCQLLCYDMV
jgi:hypothetical protein